MPYKLRSDKSSTVGRKKLLEKEYNRCRPERHKIYSTARWQRVREYKKKRNPLCEECARQGRITPMALVDHIVPIEEGGAVFDMENLQSLCAACHNKKHGGG